MKGIKLWYENNYQKTEPFDEDPQEIALELDAMFRNDDDAVELWQIKLANGKRVYQLKGKKRIILQYKET
jgi:hypothetical protein